MYFVFVNKLNNKGMFYLILVTNANLNMHDLLNNYIKYTYQRNKITFLMEIKCYIIWKDLNSKHYVFI